MQRINSIDFTRGLVMIIMALDHIRDLMHGPSLDFNPTDLSKTTAPIFFTRLVTHLCAPTFVFLAGTSCYLSLHKSGNVGAMRNFLFKRGLWLVFLEVTIVNFGIWFDPGFHTMLLQVIWAIGVGFMVLALLLKLSAKTIGMIGFAIVLLHNLLPLLPVAPDSPFVAVVTPLFGPAVYPVGSTILLSVYAPVPWLGIMLLGFAAGKLFGRPAAQRSKKFTRIGLLSLLAFAILRAVNLYGDPALWASQGSPLFTLMSFMNLTKYPPSLLYCAATLGIMFLILAFAEKVQNGFTRSISVYGKVPMFYYLLHWYVIHLVMLALMFAQGFSWAQLDFATGRFGRPTGVQSGVRLLWIYVIWLSIVTALYFPSRWFAGYKSSSSRWWLKYI